MKLVGSIFEELYGPLSHSDTVNVVVRPSCTVSELSSVDVANTAEQANSSSQLHDLATVNTSQTSAVPVTLQPPPVVDDSNEYISIDSDSDNQRAVVNPPVPLSPSEVTPTVSHQSSDIARDWSAGLLVTDGSGKSIEVITVLFHAFADVCKCVVIY